MELLFLEIVSRFLFMKKNLILIFSLYAITVFGQMERSILKFDFFNFEIFGTHRGVYNKLGSLDTIVKLEKQFSELSITFKISTSYVGSASSNIKYTSHLCKLALEYLNSKLDSRTICNCIPMGEKQMLWEKDVFVDGKLLIPNTQIPDEAFILSQEDLSVREVLRMHSNHVKILITGVK